MLNPIAGYASTQSGAQFKHIAYVGMDGHLHDLVAPLGGAWTYNLDLTAAANATVQATNAIMPSFLAAVPNAVGNVAVSVSGIGGTPQTPGTIGIGVPQFFYWGADELIHVIFPVGYGFFFPGTPGQPGDPGDFIDGVGFEYDLGEPNGAASPAGWADTPLVSAPGGTLLPTGPPLAIYTTPDGYVTVIYQGAAGSSALAMVRGALQDWGEPVEISAVAGAPSVGGDASAIYWPEDGTEHVFSVNDEGLLKELWSKLATDEITWGAHDVLHEVKSVAADPQDPSSTYRPIPIAPPAMQGVGTAAGYVWPGDTKNVAYVAADRMHVNLCSHLLTGEWMVTYISEAAFVPPPALANPRLEFQPGIPPSLLAYTSDVEHVIYIASDGIIVDLWSKGDGNWFWAGFQGGVNLETGLSAFVWAAEGTDHIVYITQEGEISEASLKQGVGPSANAGLQWIVTNVSFEVGASVSYVPPVMTSR